MLFPDRYFNESQAKGITKLSGDQCLWPILFFSIGGALTKGCLCGCVWHGVFKSPIVKEERQGEEVGTCACVISPFNGMGY